MIPQFWRTASTDASILEKLSTTQFEGAVTFKIGPIKPTFACVIELSEIDPPNAYVISVMGKGGSAGFAKGSAKVQLIDENGITVLGYTVDVRLGGRFGQMGGALLTLSHGKWPTSSSVI